MSPADEPFHASVIMPVWGRADRTLACVQGVAAHTPPAMFEVVIVDNGSPDATDDLLDMLGGDVKIIRNPVDVGFGHAANQGAAIATGRHLVFLDTLYQPLPGWLEHLVAILEAHAQIGAISPLLLCADGTVDSAGFLVAAADGASGAFCAVPRLAGARCDEARVFTPKAIDAASTSALAIRRTAFDAIGGFDEGYGCSGESLDLCLSLGAAGWNVVYEPGSALQAGDALGTSRPYDPTTAASDRRRLYQRWAKTVSPRIAVRANGAVVDTGDAPLRELHPTQWGANVAGFFDAELGIGESARLVVTALEAASVNVTTTSYYRHLNRAGHRFAHRSHQTPSRWDLNVICLNGDMLPTFATEHEEWFAGDQYNIAMWHWELTELPLPHVQSMALVDEIWVGSRFTKECIERYTEKPVVVFPLPVASERIQPQHTRAEVGIPDGFVFGFMYDVNSVPARKNPDGLIEAFRSAFTPGEGPHLLIKTINGDRRPGEMARLRSLADDRQDIKLVDRYLSAPEVRDWTGLIDCYASLHRSEGFGLTMAEAMTWGIPVVATAYSGNLDFMSESNSYLVGWSPSKVPDGSAPYPPDASWAEPDLDVAANILRKVWADPRAAKEIGKQGQADIARTHGIAASTQLVAERFERITQTLAARRRTSCKRPGHSTTSSDIIAGARMYEPPRAARLVTSTPIRLNLGAGDDRREGFISIDLRPDTADIVATVDSIPLPDGAVSEILASDVLEHLPAQRTRGVLDEWRRVLVDGGKLTIRVPNLAALAQLLIEHPHTRVNVIRNIYGGHRFGPNGAWDTHHTGWTPDMLHAELTSAGFVVLSDDGDTNNTVVAMKSTYLRSE